MQPKRQLPALNAGIVFLLGETRRVPSSRHTPCFTTDAEGHAGHLHQVALVAGVDEHVGPHLAARRDDACDRGTVLLDVHKLRGSFDDDARVAEHLFEYPLGNMRLKEERGRAVVEARASALLDGADATKELTRETTDDLRTALTGIGVGQSPAHHAAHPGAGFEEEHLAPRPCRGYRGGNTGRRCAEHDNLCVRRDRGASSRLSVVLHSDDQEQDRTDCNGSE